MKYLLIVLGLLMYAAAPIHASPSVEFERTAIDVGEVTSGKEVNVVFPFKNTGDEDLEITSVSTSCGSCTSAKAKETKIEPGRSSEIEVSFSPTSVGGYVRKTLTIKTNDPANPAVALKVVGKVIALATLTPDKLSLGNISVGSTHERAITITPIKPEGFSITKVESSGKKVTATKIEQDGKRSYIIKLSITAGNSPGRLLEMLSMVTGLSGNPTIPFLVYGNVIGPKNENP